MQIASHLHGLNMDAWMTLAEFANKCDSETHGAIIDLTTGGFLDMMSAIQKELPTKNIFDIYAKANRSSSKQ